MNWQRILITGASSGLGWSLAIELARPGVTIWISGRDRERLSHLAVLVQEKGATAEIVVADLTTEEGQQRVVGIVEKLSPDLLIHSAGLGSYGRFVDTEVADSLRIIQVNVMAIITITHAWCRSLMSSPYAAKN